MKRALTIFKCALLTAVLLLAAVYVGDYCAVRYRIPRSRNFWGTVTIQRYYAVTQKNRTSEFYFDPPRQEVCVHSLFPHFGSSPCWYLNRKKIQRVNL